jgi:hypothetical protein
VSPAIRYFRERTPIPAWYQVHRGTKDALIAGVRVLPFGALCAELDIP